MGVGSLSCVGTKKRIRSQRFRRIEIRLEIQEFAYRCVSSCCLGHAVECTAEGTLDVIVVPIRARRDWAITGTQVCRAAARLVLFTHAVHFRPEALLEEGDLLEDGVAAQHLFFTV